MALQAIRTVINCFFFNYFEYEYVKAKMDALNERLSRIKKDMDRMKRTKKASERAGDER